MNTNCLKGMRCPNPDCGSYGPFRIEVTIVVEMHDDGCDLNEYHRGLDYKDRAYCQCVLCSFGGQVFEFQEGAAHLLNLSIGMARHTERRQACD